MSDPGLQNERTGLAWQRTMLSGLACSLLIARLLATESVTLAVIAALLALAGTAALGWVGLHRFRRRAAWSDDTELIGGALPHLLLTGVLVITGVSALAYVLVI